MRTLALAAAVALLAPASFAAAQGVQQPSPAPANARFYADCFAASAAARTYDRNGGYLRFTCYGPAARAFFDGLAGWSTPKGWERAADGRTYRFTAEVKKGESGSGIDRCWKSDDAAAGDNAYGCLLVFPAGGFLDG